MATSNWQHITYCCELLFALSPGSVLDLGMGFGRWGMLTREMCDVWQNRITPEQWQVELVGVEAFQKLVQPYHGAFYDEVIVADALDYVRGAERTFDLIILGDVLEHLPRGEAQELLSLCRSKAHYTLLCVPLGEGWQQGEMYGNPYERHRSVWRNWQLAELEPVCDRRFRNYHGLVHGVYLFPSTELDERDYWRGRRWRLLVPHFREIENLNPSGPQPGLAHALRRYFATRPRRKAVAGAVYRALRGIGGAVRPAPRRDERPPTVQWQVSLEHQPVLAVCPKGWYGVTTSTRANFPNVLLYEGGDPDATAAQVLERGFNRIVFSGMPRDSALLASAVHRRSADAHIAVHYHGSLAQNADPQIRERFQRVVRLARDGVAARVGCVKAGLSPVLRRMGIDACYVPNRVAAGAPAAPRPAGSPRKVGVFVRDILRKNAHTQFAAALMLEDAEVHAVETPDLSCLPDRSSVVVHGSMPHQEFLGLLCEMDICLYVSLSECYPMVVAEALTCGVPCLTSRCHEILAHDEELARLLLVDAYDNPVAIAEQAEAVLADRERIGRRCGEYACELNRRAEAAIHELLDFAVYNSD